jgi:hypothetical protein
MMNTNEIPGCYRVTVRYTVETVICVEAESAAAAEEKVMDGDVATVPTACAAQNADGSFTESSEYVDDTFEIMTVEFANR